MKAPAENIEAAAPGTGPGETTGERILLVGNPNVGKSVIFGRLTGRYVTVSNYPGTTVEVTRGKGRIAGRDVTVIDTPGINTLIPQSEDEKVTRDIILETGGADRARVIQVGDTKNLPRALLLSLQLAEMDLPFVLCLNMKDEADTRGILIDASGLSSLLGVEVIQTVATRRQGLDGLQESFPEAPRTKGPLRVKYDRRIEEEIETIAPHLPEAGISRRSLALMVLSGDATLSEWLAGRVTPSDLDAIEASCRRLRAAFPRNVATVINEARLEAASRMARQVTGGNGAPARRPGLTEKVLSTVGTLSMHPVLGLGFLGLVLYLMYLFVGGFGAGTAVDWLETGVFGQDSSLVLTRGTDGSWIAGPESMPREGRLVLRGTSSGPDGSLRLTLSTEGRSAEGWVPRTGPTPRLYSIPASGRFDPVTAIGEGLYETTFHPGPEAPVSIEAHTWTGLVNPAVHGFFLRHVPWSFGRDLFVGPYGLLTMGLTYAIAIVLPIVATFFFAFCILEDSGYLPRLAIMLNRAFRMMGLNGKAVLPMVLGLGCDTMATLTTRILETKKERTIVILLLALGVPCSAQLGVILGMLAALSLSATLIWSCVILGVLLLVGFLASKVIPGRGSDFIMEVPPIRIPSLRNIATKTMARIEWYLKEAVPLFLLGTLVLFVADRVRLLGLLERALSPLVTGVLGLPGAATDAFLIGFLRRDFGSAGLYRLAEAGRLDPVQVVVSLVTVTLFIPCIANLFMIVKERGAKVALAVAAFIFPFAILVGGTLNLVLRAFGGLA